MCNRYVSITLKVVMGIVVNRSMKQVSWAGISNYIPQFTVGCKHLCLP